ncbi:MAG: hypothetical protein Ct9H300mP8_09990 [Gammaproteobacteria bacterium]|nr:MAG: hypothetical protein Ct9H300mP8_09990 [Gammaproteobacteria bacterium]
MVPAAEIDRLPREVWPDEFSRCNVRPVGNRGEATGVKTLDTVPRCLLNASSAGGLNWSSRSIAQVVVAKRIGDQKDDVFHDAVSCSDRLLTLVKC